MLHKINLPRTDLSWVVALQYRLFKAICAPDITSADVTLEWVEQLVPRMETKRLYSLCNRSYEKSTMLKRMQAIADFSADLKTRLLADFEHDQKLLWERKNNPTVPFNLVGLASLTNEAEKNVVYRFFEGFYSANIYQSTGYYIPRRNGHSKHFHLGSFKERFDNNNRDIEVCPFCDGPPVGLQVDHYFPKKHHPFLSCHPLNLIPVCGDCNGSKLQTVALTEDADDPLHDWFHPYFSVGVDSFSIVIQFEEQAFRPKIQGMDDDARGKLKNWVKLIKLTGRWQTGLRRKINHTRKQIRQYRQRQLTKNQPLPTTDELMQKFVFWEEDVVLGSTYHGLLERAFLMTVINGNQDIFDEVRLPAEHDFLDPVTVLPLAVDA